MEYGGGAAASVGHYDWVEDCVTVHRCTLTDQMLEARICMVYALY